MQKKQRKRRGGKPLSLRERSIIELRWCRDGRTVTEIADELGRNKSSISRELDGKPRIGSGKYDADRAHAKALDRIGSRGNVPKTVKHELLRSYIETKMRDERWSPEQVSLRLPIEFPNDSRMRVAPETIYQEVYRRVYRGGNGAVKKGTLDLRPYLARRHKQRAKKGFRKVQKAERDASLPSIERRPLVVEKRSRIGDWEDDTLVSRASLARIKNVTERRSGVTLFGKTDDGTAENCDAVLIHRLGALPSSVRKTLTRDRGKENLRWQEVEQSLGLDVFFAHPYCSHERGTNENTNGLIRRFFPKKTDLALLTGEEIARAEYLINTRPRRRHGGLTPEEVFFKATGVALYS
ncbi:IS30 family transposase [Patescibacteria group bacterium]|nr:IS30 family transposase [Patescibacteria group bacterium]